MLRALAAAAPPRRNRRGFDFGGARYESIDGNSART
jgi:hypothetical protein